MTYSLELGMLNLRAVALNYINGHMNFIRPHDETPDATNAPKHLTTAVLRIDTGHRLKLVTHLCGRDNVSPNFPDPSSKPQRKSTFRLSPTESNKETKPH